MVGEGCVEGETSMCEMKDVTDVSVQNMGMNLYMYMCMYICIELYMYMMSKKI